MVKRYKARGYIKSKRVKSAILAVPREKFMPKKLRQYAYRDNAFPIPGDGRQTISAPYMYPVSFEPLELTPGIKVLEIGAAALLKELIGDNGVVVAIEINPDTFQFAKKNLKETGYDVKLILGDGTMGYPEFAPYDAISVTASTPQIPPPLISQLSINGKLIEKS